MDSLSQSVRLPQPSSSASARCSREPRLSRAAATGSSLARGLGISALEQQPAQRGFALELELLAEGVQRLVEDANRLEPLFLNLAGGQE